MNNQTTRPIPHTMLLGDVERHPRETARQYVAGLFRALRKRGHYETAALLLPEAKAVLMRRGVCKAEG